MATKLPSDAFERYLALGSSRSYRELADRLGVSKRAITSVARRERWTERIGAIELEAQKASDRKAVETLEVVNERHLRVYRSLQAKALEGLRSLNMSKASDIVRALEISVRGEREIRGIRSQGNEVGVGVSVSVSTSERQQGPKPPEGAALVSWLREYARIIEEESAPGGAGAFDREDEEGGDAVVHPPGERLPYSPFRRD